MRGFLLALALFLMPVWAQGPGRLTQAQFVKLLTFEDAQTEESPKGWFGGPAETIHTDRSVVHSGAWAVRLERTASSPQAFSVITSAVPVYFAGSEIELRGFLRTEDVSGFAGLWLRQDGDRPNLVLDNMEKRQLKGSTEWAEYSIKMPIHSEATRLYFGVLVSGTGKAWADDLQLLVDGKPIWDAPERKEPETVLTRDHEFDGGSKVSVQQLTPAQVANLTLLGRVWGFLKYHHSRVRAGEIHWDYELFRVLPAVLAASDAVEGQKALAAWVKAVGTSPECSPCGALKSQEAHLRPGLAWLSDTALLGSELSALLQAVHRNRPAGGKQFYLGQNSGVGNGNFDRELPYKGVSLPDAGYQLLALYRFWNIVEYWFPYRDLIGEPWEGVLREFVQRVALAKTRDDYQLQMMALIARVHDTHANLWSSLQVRPPRGTCQTPAVVRFVGKQAVVTGYAEGSSGPLQAGDVIEAVDGIPVSKLHADWAPWYAASNEPTRLRDMGRFLLRGECAAAGLKIRRGAETLEVAAARVPLSGLKMPQWHDRPGEAFQKLGESVAYLKFSSVQNQAARYMDAAKGTQGLILDLRNDPSSFLIFALGALLVDKPTGFARFTTPDLENPGAFQFTPVLTLEPGKVRYEGKIVVLVDEVTQSSAEYHAMAFRAGPRATVIGSTTAGADGNVSSIPLPGGLRTMISGIGVFYADNRPTQRIGIVPDIEVRPTVEGIRSGRDEVLERALRVILGDGVAQEEIEKLARR
ncbi:MAG: hypothetical protein JNK87_09765 [Bryobacterales bacterium]|nr:hypothetical protein [Bryobacterales bacterium]